MSYLRTLAIGLVWIFLLGEAAPANDQLAQFAARVPGNACLAIASGDVGSTCEAFRKSRLGAKLCGSEFEPLIAELTKRGLASALHLRPVFGFDWNDLAKTRDPGGLVVFALADGSLGSAWIFTPHEKLTATPACMAAAADYFNAQAFRGESAKRGNANLSIYHPPENRKQELPRVLFIGSTYYGVASSQAAANAVIEVAPTKSLATRPEFGKLAPAVVTGAADVSFLVKPFELWELMLRERVKAAEQQQAQNKQQPAAKAVEPPAEDELTAGRRLGLAGVQVVAGRVSLTAKEPCEWSIDATVQIARPYAGVMRLMEFRPGQLMQWPDWLRADAVTAGRWRWDFPLAMKGFGNLYDQANEPGPDGEGLFEDLLDGLRDDPEGVQVDLRRDLFEQLTPDMMRISDEQPATAKSPADERRWLYVAGVRDVSKVADALTRFYKGDKRVAQRKSGDFDVWTVGEGASLFVEGESESLVTVRGLAVGRNTLLFSTDVGMLESALAPADVARLTSDPNWSRLLAWAQPRANEAVTFESLARTDRILAPSYAEGMKSLPVSKVAADGEEPAPPAESLAARFWRLLLLGNAEGAPELPYDAAPKFDVLRDALPPSGIVMSQSGEGWTIRFGLLQAADKVASP